MSLYQFQDWVLTNVAT